MAKIPPEVVEFLQEGHLAYVSTVSPDGTPHCVPKGSVAYLDEEHLVFADLTVGQTRKNVEHNPSVAITVVNPAAYQGYEFSGTAEIVERGKEFDEIAAKVEDGQMDYTNAKHAVKVKVNQIKNIGYWP